MASIVDLCWTTSQDLLRDLDLDTLYACQVKTIGGDRFRDYPHLLLVHTGKIMIGINLGERSASSDAFQNFTSSRGRSKEDPLLTWKYSKEPWE
ncbi:MAG: hypothetical protein FJY85_24145 [Deltaproteobacteria bacterium]|nr:hypothetical protein [Deltaproteobacteria bacterium]